MGKYQKLANLLRLRKLLEKHLGLGLKRELEEDKIIFLLKIYNELLVSIKKDVG